jgi:DNA repair protein RecO (recombination protein O)
MIVRTEAIVLRSVNYGETSQIVTLYTQAMGTMAVIAKGARGQKSRFGSALQLMSHVQVVFYFKKSRNVHTLSESTHLTLFRKIYRELDRMAIGLQVIESIRVLMPHPEPDEFTFGMLLDVLKRLEEADNRWNNLLPYFQLRLSAALGFAPALDREDVRGIGSAGGFLSLTDGNVSESKPAESSAPASRKAIRAIGVLVHTELDTVMLMDLERPVLLEIVELVEMYLRYHVEDFRPSRSKAVFDRIL